MSHTNRSYHWLYFSIQPFFTLMHYLVNFRHPAAKNIMWAFTVFFGMSIAVGRESQNSDINRYMEDIPLLSGLDLSWTSALEYYGDSGEIDILNILLSILVSRFTDNGYILLIVYGFIFGYFYSRNMWFVLDRITGKLKFISVILLFCLFLVVPIWELGGFRFWTATHVFLYGLLPYLFISKKKSLVWCFLTPFLFHYAFIVPLLILILYFILGNRLRLYFYFFVASLVIGEINITQFNRILESYAPAAFLERSSSYRGEEKVESYRTRGNAVKIVWYARYLKSFLNWPLYALLILLYFKSFTVFKEDVRLARLFCFTLFLYGFANTFATIPSGGRYLSLAAILAVSFLVIYIQNNYQDKLLERAFKFALPFLILFIVVKMRMSWYYFSLETLISNPLIAIFNIGENTSINDIIKF